MRQVNRLKSNVPSNRKLQRRSARASGVGKHPVGTPLLILYREDEHHPWITSDQLAGYVLGRGGKVQLTWMMVRDEKRAQRLQVESLKALGIVK